MKRTALGKGLKAFLPEEYGIIKEEKYMELDIHQLKRNPNQPRSNFDSQTLEELASSIKETGILQPVVVVPDGENYKIIVGERRWRAAQMVGLKKIPAIIRNMTTAQQHEASLIENIQREDLNPMEIAHAYQKITEDLQYTQEEVADKVGKDRTSVTNYLRLLKLPPEIQKMISDGKLSMGHARALITVEDSSLQIKFARLIIKKGLSVRNVENMISKFKQKAAPGSGEAQEQESGPGSQRPLDPDLLALQEEFIKLLGTKVIITGEPQKGTIRIHYHSVDELNRIFEKFKGENA